MYNRDLYILMNKHEKNEKILIILIIILIYNIVGYAFWGYIDLYT